MTIKKLSKDNENWNFKAESIKVFNPKIDKKGGEIFKIKNICEHDGSGLAICIGPENSDCNCLKIKDKIIGISGNSN